MGMGQGYMASRDYGWGGDRYRATALGMSVVEYLLRLCCHRGMMGTKKIMFIWAWAFVNCDGMLASWPIRFRGG